MSDKTVIFPERRIFFILEYKVNEISSKDISIKEHNKVVLYLFNSINWKIKKYIKNDKILDNHKQMF